MAPHVEPVGQERHRTVRKSRHDLDDHRQYGDDAYGQRSPFGGFFPVLAERMVVYPSFNGFCVHVAVLNLLETVQCTVDSRQKESCFPDPGDTHESYLSQSGRYYEKGNPAIIRIPFIYWDGAEGGTYALACAKLSATCAQLTVFHHASMYSGRRF